MNGKKSVLVQISNNSDIDYELERTADYEAFSAPEKIVLLGRKTVLLELKAKPKAASPAQSEPLNYRVTNLLVGPDVPLAVTLPIQVSTLTKAED